MKEQLISIEILFPTICLLVAVIDDLMTKKYHNWLFISSFVVALFVSIYFYGSQFFQTSLMGLLTSLFFLLPLVLAHVVGAGDLKLMLVFGLATVSELLSFQYFGSTAIIGYWLGFPIALLMDYYNLKNLLNRYYVRGGCK